MGRQPLYSLAIAFGFGIGSYAVGWWCLKLRRGNVMDDDDAKT